MASLLNWLTELITPDSVSSVATSLGESDAAVSRGLRAGITSVLAGVVAKTGDPGFMGRIHELATNRDNDIDTSGDVASASVRAVASGSKVSALGGALLSTVFGGQANEVGGIVARAAGFDKPSSGASTLAVVAPLVLAFLGQRIRDRALGISGFTNMLAGQRDSILEAAPPGLRNLLGMGPAPLHVNWPESRPDEGLVPPPRASVGANRGNRWLWPVVAGAAALALLWALMGRNRSPQPAATIADSAAAMARTTLDSAASAVRRTVDTAAGTVSRAISDLGAFARRTLPNGTVLNVPERGIESRLIAFITDAARPVNDTTWFDFDRLNFATGSATILPESQEQLNNIAAVLAGYPNVKVKVGGYTDNSGDPSANMRLSQERAESVRTALTGKGIAGARMTAEGYGDKHPVADNSTEEGRARNRRIALRVTAK